MPSFGPDCEFLSIFLGRLSLNAGFTPSFIEYNQNLLTIWSKWYQMSHWYIVMYIHIKIFLIAASTRVPENRGVTLFLSPISDILSCTVKTVKNKK